MGFISKIFCLLTVLTISKNSLGQNGAPVGYCKSTVRLQLLKSNRTDRYFVFNETSPCPYDLLAVYEHTNLTDVEKCTVEDYSPGSCQYDVPITSFDLLISCQQVNLTSYVIINGQDTAGNFPVHYEGPILIMVENLNLRMTGSFKGPDFCFCPSPVYSASIKDIYVYDGSNNEIYNYELAVRTVLTDPGCTQNTWPEIADFNICDSCQ